MKAKVIGAEISVQEKGHSNYTFREYLKNTEEKEHPKNHVNSIALVENGKVTAEASQTFPNEISDSVMEKIIPLKVRTIESGSISPTLESQEGSSVDNAKISTTTQKLKISRLKVKGPVRPLVTATQGSVDQHSKSMNDSSKVESNITTTSHSHTLTDEDPGSTNNYESVTVQNKEEATGDWQKPLGNENRTQKINVSEQKKGFVIHLHRNREQQPRTETDKQDNIVVICKDSENYESEGIGNAIMNSNQGKLSVLPFDGGKSVLEDDNSRFENDLILSHDIISDHCCKESDVLHESLLEGELREEHVESGKYSKDRDSFAEENEAERKSSPRSGAHKGLHYWPSERISRHFNDSCFHSSPGNCHVTELSDHGKNELSRDGNYRDSPGETGLSRYDSCPGSENDFSDGGLVGNYAYQSESASSNIIDPIAYNTDNQRGINGGFHEHRKPKLCSYDRKGKFHTSTHGGAITRLAPRSNPSFKPKVFHHNNHLHRNYSDMDDNFRPNISYTQEKELSDGYYGNRAQRSHINVCFNKLGNRCDDTARKNHG